MMKKKLETTYGKTLRSLFFVVNPLKKKIIKTHCIVHKYINTNAVEVLKNEGFLKEYEFYKKYIKSLNEGVTWADQDFKSSNHFFHYIHEKGLYGFSNALCEFKKYYNKSVGYYNAGDVNKSMFYFGAACHLIQDATVPQHVNNRLLNSHRNFETWIISKIMSDYSYVSSSGIVRYNNIEDYIRNNAKLAQKTHLKFINIKDKGERYKKVSTTILKQAQVTTSGLMLDFYDNTIKK